MAPRETLEDPMTKPKTKPKAAAHSTARKTAKSASGKRTPPASSRSAARPGTKHARIIAMLRTPAGATIAALVTATKWQQHSVRGFLAGVVCKRLGLNLVSEQTDKGRVYRIKDGNASPAAADQTGSLMRCRRTIAMVVARPECLLRTRSRICAGSISGGYVHVGRVSFKGPLLLT
jgi:hypothetical protein